MNGSHIIINVRVLPFIHCLVSRQQPNRLHDWIKMCSVSEESKSPTDKYQTIMGSYFPPDLSTKLEFLKKTHHNTNNCILNTNSSMHKRIGFWGLGIQLQQYDLYCGSSCCGIMHSIFRGDIQAVDQDDLHHYCYPQPRIQLSIKNPEHDICGDVIREITLYSYEQISGCK